MKFFVWEDESTAQWSEDDWVRTQKKIHQWKLRQDNQDNVAKLKDKVEIVDKLHFMPLKLHFFGSANYTFLSELADLEDADFKSNI